MFSLIQLKIELVKISNRTELLMDRPYLKSESCELKYSIHLIKKNLGISVDCEMN